MSQSTLLSEPRPRRGMHAARPGARGRPSDRAAKKAERLHFLKAFLRKPMRVGAPCPSSPALARAMLQECDVRNASVVVELGPGTGAFTRLILERIGRQTLFLALELDQTCVARLRGELAGVTVYHDSAERIPHYLGRHQREQAEVIISGLPWTNMRPQVQDRILDAVLQCLSPKGVFTTFAYAHSYWLPTAVRFRKRLKRHFGSVKTSRLVWRNLPPAYVYRCRR
jgi:phosphatidylethanolamine/phosphatidyl-N-methylethanolamine N-methyltransferase